MQKNITRLCTWLSTPENHPIHHYRQVVINKFILLIAFSYLVGVAFSFVPKGVEKNYFLVGGEEMYFKTWAYYAFEHVSRMMFIYAIILLFPGAWILFWVEFIDLIDYLICYNETWFTAFDHNFEYNDFKLIIVGLWMAWRLGRQ
jgi:hypothetical protein